MKAYWGSGILNTFTEKNSYDSVTKSFRTGRLELELQMVQLSTARCSCITLLWVSLVSFAAITLCVTSQRVFITAVVYFVIDSVRKLFDTPSYVTETLWGIKMFISPENAFDQSVYPNRNSLI
jgi:hypothetical protein